MLRVSAFLLSCALCAGAADPAWKSLFDGKTFEGWHDPGLRSPAGDGWAIEDGSLMARPKPRFREDLISKQEFGDFELAFEWKIAPGANSGLKYLVQQVEFLDLGKVPPGEIDKQLAAEIEGNLSDRSKVSPSGRGKDYSIGFEFQLIDDAKHNDARGEGKHACGSLYSLIAPSASPAKPAGQWNEARVLVRGNHVEHWINGIKVIDASLDDPRVSEGLEKRWGRNHPVYRLLTQRPKRRAPIAITHHGDQTWFRNIRIREY